MKEILFTAFLVVRITAGEAQNAERIVLVTDKQWYYPGESLWFSVNVFDDCADTLSQLSRIAYVELIGADNKPVNQMKVPVNDSHGQGAFMIGENILTGNYSIVAYTNWMRNFGATTYFRQNVQVVNPLKAAPINVANTQLTESKNAARIKIAAPKRNYAKRERVFVNITDTLSEWLSVSIFRTDALQRDAAPTILKDVANPCNVNVTNTPKYVAEDRGHIIIGRVIDKRSQQPAPGIRGYLSIVDSPDNFHVATSDSAGVIRFDVGYLSGKRELVFKTNNSKDSNYSIEPVNPYAEQIANISNAEKQNVFEALPNVVNEAMVSAQVQRHFNLPTLEMKDTIEITQPFYGKPDAFYLMGDYVHFTTVEEILREYVTTVGVQKRNGHLIPVVYDVLSENKPFAGPPLVLVNGVPVFDLDLFMEMNTDEFHSIGVLGKKYFIGHETFYGIIDVRLNTTLKNFGNNATVIDYDAPAKSPSFYSPFYDTEEDRSRRRPDFRNVLYWNPILKKDKDENYNFSFYTSDMEGEYAIVVRSISGSGKVETSQTFIQVK